MFLGRVDLKTKMKDKVLLTWKASRTHVLLHTAQCTCSLWSYEAQSLMQWILSRVTLVQFLLRPILTTGTGSKRFQPKLLQHSRGRHLKASSLIMHTCQKYRDINTDFLNAKLVSNTSSWHTIGRSVVGHSCVNEIASNGDAYCVIYNRSNLVPHDTILIRLISSASI